MSVEAIRLTGRAALIKELCLLLSSILALEIKKLVLNYFLALDKF